MAKKILIGVFVALAIAVIVLFFVVKNNKKKQQKKEDESNNSNTGSNNNTSNTTPSNVLVLEAAQFPLKNGSRGKAVKIIQALVGFSNKDVDGIWGSNTEKAVQKNLNLNSITENVFVQKVVHPAYSSTAFPLKNGSNNAFVKAVQIMVGADVDGIWGSGTEKAVLAATNKNSITAQDFANLIYKTFNIQPSKTDVAAQAVGSLAALGIVF